MLFPGPVIEHQPLAAKTTLGVGGPARYFAHIDQIPLLLNWLDFANHHALPVVCIGGGSNLLVNDSGFDGIVLHIGHKTQRSEPDGPSTLLTLGAGLPWDNVVAQAVQNKLAGLECLSGIPGCVGAAPIQNIGAYGQELAESLHTVDAIAIDSGQLQTFTAEQCGFGYRSSTFKGPWHGRFIITEITLRLLRDGPPTIRYSDLKAAFADNDHPSLTEVREQVLRVRRSKSMVLNPNDPNGRSAGSFFVNPIIPNTQLKDVEEAVARHLGPEINMPRWPTAQGTKLAAAWLIERAGFHKGYTHKQAGLSSRHCLALINRGDARAEELVELALLIRTRVYATFGVYLTPEPQMLGFEPDILAQLGKA